MDYAKFAETSKLYTKHIKDSIPLKNAVDMSAQRLDSYIKSGKMPHSEQDFEYWQGEYFSAISLRLQRIYDQYKSFKKVEQDVLCINDEQTFQEMLQELSDMVKEAENTVIDCYKDYQNAVREFCSVFKIDVQEGLSKLENLALESKRLNTETKMKLQRLIANSVGNIENQKFFVQQMNGLLTHDEQYLDFCRTTAQNCKSIYALEFNGDHYPVLKDCENFVQQMEYLLSAKQDIRYYTSSVINEESTRQMVENNLPSNKNNTKK